MKQYLAVFIGTDAAMLKWQELDEAQREERTKIGIEAWKTWVIANQKAIVHHGAPLGKTKKVDAKGLSDFKNRLTAWTVVQADSHEAAAKMFLNHPHFTIFPGNSVEITECLPIPT